MQKTPRAHKEREQITASPLQCQSRLEELLPLKDLMFERRTFRLLKSQERHNPQQQLCFCEREVLKLRQGLLRGFF